MLVTSGPDIAGHLQFFSFLYVKNDIFIIFDKLILTGISFLKINQARKYTIGNISDIW